jgi:IS5 family transposase
LGIRSERRLCEEVHLNLAYRWFCRLGLDGCVPDHSTFSKNRHGRFRESDLLRRLFETVLQRCIDEGLVGGEGFAVDASLIHADAGDRNRIEGAAGLPPKAAGRAVEEYLAVLDDAAFGAASEVTPRTGVLCLFDQLPDRHRQRDHRRCRSDDGDPPSGDPSGKTHDRAIDRALRSLPHPAHR